MKTQKYYRLGVQPLCPILSGLIFDDKKEAKEQARERNRIGEYKGRGVYVMECNEYGTPTNQGKKIK